MRIALDAMGGDDAPAINIDGAVAAVQADSDLHVVLVGDEAVLKEKVSRAEYDGSQIEVVHASQFVGMDEKPTEALRKKPDTSIAVCWKLMATKEVSAVVSAGNTGAVVAAGLRTRLFLKGVKRPGIAVCLPTLKGRSVLMDVGANPAARPEHLLQYGIMGKIYSQEILGVETPRVGIMNIGSEDGKGTELVREARQMLSECCIEKHFIGNVEGRGLYQGDADVVICEGFVGNVVLKVSEGMADMMMKTLASQVTDALDLEKEKAGRAFHDIAKRYQYSETGGAPLLGVDGVCLIAHGSSNSVSIRNALRTAVEFHDKQINAKIIEALAE